MTSKALREFNASLGGNKDELIQEGTKIARQLHDYGLVLPYTHIKIKGTKVRVELTTDGSLRAAPCGVSYYYRSDVQQDLAKVETSAIKRLVDNGRRRLEQAESRFDEVFSLYPTDVAELVFDGINNRSVLLDKLISKKKKELGKLFLMRRDLFKRLYVQMEVNGFGFSYDIGHNYTYLMLPKMNLKQKLNFLIKFPLIKDEIEKRLNKLFAGGNDANISN